MRPSSFGDVPALKAVEGLSGIEPDEGADRLCAAQNLVGEIGLICSGASL